MLQDKLVEFFSDFFRKRIKTRAYVWNGQFLLSIYSEWEAQFDEEGVCPETEKYKVSEKDLFHWWNFFTTLLGRFSFYF